VRLFLFSIVLLSTCLSAATIRPLGEQDPVAAGFDSGGVSNGVRGWRFTANADVNVLELGSSNPLPNG
jgi:hypothetical protein